MMTRGWWWTRAAMIVVALGPFALPPAASATVLVAADLGELVTSARAIVHGRVVDATSQWLEGRRGIETIVTLEVVDALKGPGGASITFRVPGGQMGPYKSFMPGAPSFSAGDDVIVFLAGDGPAIPHIVGFSQGVYRVAGVGTGRMVRPGVPGPAGASSVTLARGAGSRMTPLDAFETEVRTLVHERAAAKPGRPDHARVP